MQRTTTKHEANAFSASIAREWATLAESDAISLLRSFDSSDDAERGRSREVSHVIVRHRAAPPLASILAETDETNVDERTQVETLLAAFSM